MFDSKEIVLKMLAKDNYPYWAGRKDINLNKEKIYELALLDSKMELEKKLYLAKIELNDAEKELFKNGVKETENCLETFTEEQVLTMRPWKILTNILIYNNSLLGNIDYKESEKELLEFASEEEKTEYWIIRREEEETSSPEIQYILAEFFRILGNRKRKSSPLVLDLPRFHKTEASLFFSIKAANQGYLPALEIEKDNLRWNNQYKCLAQLILAFLAKKGDNNAKREVEYELQTERYSHNIPRLFEYNPEGLRLMFRL